MTIDHEKVLNENVHNFPVFISLKDADLKTTSLGGHVNSSEGADIYFTGSDGKKVLPHEIVSFNPSAGELKAWVTVPSLSCSSDTGFFIKYGNPSRRAPRKAGNVWDARYAKVLHLNGALDPNRDVPESEQLNVRDEITVQAWVYSDSCQPEVIQPLVGKWALQSSFTSFDSYDASNTDGLDTRGYFGAVFDGRYIYFSPIRLTSDYSGAHGNVLRYDTHGDFHDPDSYDAFDAGNIGGLKTKGYCGLAFDGRYVYFVPRHDGTEYHSRFLRYDTNKEFKEKDSWEVYDAGIASSHQGAAFDGTYLYFPAAHHFENGNHVYDGKAIRFDTRGDFKDPSNWKVFDTKGLSGLESVCFDGANFDGRYVYLAPIYTQVVVRYDTRKDFGDPGGWSAFDAKPLGMKVLVGIIFDGRYIYPVPYQNSTVIRYDTYSDFSEQKSWSVFNPGKVKGLETTGFAGGFFDGKYVYFQPFTRDPKEGEGEWVAHSNFLRYDTQGPFDSLESWDACDAGKTASMETVGYNSGVFDGRYYYSSPYRNTKECIGKILRYDTVGSNGTFVLSYCVNGSNGGLSASVTGPGFTVNTVKGPLSVLAGKALLPGWHYLSGVYDGKAIKLFIDGMLVGERSGTGELQANNVAVSIGRLHESSARFKGIINEVRISQIARSDNWIKTEYQNLINPSEFVRRGKEEKVK